MNFACSEYFVRSYEVFDRSGVSRELRQPWQDPVDVLLWPEDMFLL